MSASVMQGGHSDFGYISLIRPETPVNACAPNLAHLKGSPT